jgi:uncharacterized membrane protein YeaQ/YmgE (transglycosylase-associated protein family)
MARLVLWIVGGIIIGLLGSIAMRTEAERGTMINIVVGVAGTLTAALVLNTVFGQSTVNQSSFSVPALLLPLLGAIVLLAVVNGFHRLVQRYRPGV